MDVRCAKACVKQLIHLDSAADSALESAWRPHTTTRMDGVSSVIARADENGKAVRLDKMLSWSRSLSHNRYVRIYVLSAFTRL